VWGQNIVWGQGLVGTDVNGTTIWGLVSGPDTTVWGDAGGNDVTGSGGAR